MVPENYALMTIRTFVRLRTNEITSYLIVFFMISFFDCTNWLALKPTPPASQSLSLRRLFFFFLQLLRQLLLSILLLKQKISVRLRTHCGPCSNWETFPRQRLYFLRMHEQNQNGGQWRWKGISRCKGEIKFEKMVFMWELYFSKTVVFCLVFFFFKWNSDSLILRWRLSSKAQSCRSELAWKRGTKLKSQSRAIPIWYCAFPWLLSFKDFIVLLL